MSSAAVVRRVVTPLVFAVGLAPIAVLAGRAATGGLGVNPIEEATLVTGRWALRFLLATLSVTPLRRLTGWQELVRVRRPLGLFAFAYAAGHFSIYVAVDQFFAWRFIAADIAKRPYITVGFTAFVLLVPLAITSTRGWIRRLGRRWARLHRLVYVSAVCGVVHYYWKVKADTRDPLVYAGVLAALFAVRLAWRARAWRLAPGRSQGRAGLAAARPTSDPP